MNVGRGDIPQERRGNESASARSALNLRLLLAAFGLVVCAALAILAFASDAPAPGIVLAVLAGVAIGDLVVVQRRRRRRGGRHSLFE